jgi:hypothetical protein
MYPSEIQVLEEAVQLLIERKEIDCWGKLVSDTTLKTALVKQNQVCKYAYASMLS